MIPPWEYSQTWKNSVCILIEDIAVRWRARKTQACLRPATMPRFELALGQKERGGGWAAGLEGNIETEVYRMKTKIGLLAACAAVAFASMNLSQAAVPVTDNLPGLPVQGAEYWKVVEQEQAAVQQPRTQNSEPRTAPSGAFFYTGKPYVAELGAYSFQFRNYDPELQRWTTADPSGFPDGANNYEYAPVPTAQIDTNGLITLIDNQPGQASGEFTTLFNLGGYATYSGFSFADANDNSGTVYLFSNIVGVNTPFATMQSLNLTPGIDVYSTGSGLNYNITGSNQLTGANGTVGTGFTYNVDGVGTDTLTFHVFVDYALHASSVSGGGTDGISWSDAIRTASYALGTFVFQE
ncbi:MAG: hypothetical protein PHD76_11920 [Methylacidiphilales bacterium]|nr:hypothetical protein [Candidatus Methylacidiphilales bacterium]